MTSTLNVSLIEGRLTKDPELHYTKNGLALCKFNVAINKSTKVGDKLTQDVTYIAINVWNKVAESCAKYLKKGTLIRAKGRLKQNSWQDKEGVKRSKISLEAAGVDFLSYPSYNKKNGGEKVAL
ncbi:MAG: hypothetical protein A2086_11120 [Spirochaetes bacterium GWD1_27_9]|nr:MAG: hypothetical protein A2Z98_01580 [Spirochaetes bacterium GWB1_27_13]OHD22769.1 MAG: hypothetical protein A2Y34_00190 [Spirochaetes bacterium GWC1_27_15]OHD39101.1 MAG: hypothetical protein A2086_11120 [Spirochaetes bacterium GWD1_27_9]